jgi:hypothetical protein
MWNGGVLLVLLRLPFTTPTHTLYTTFIAITGRLVGGQAILMVIMPLSFVAAESAWDAKVYVLVSTVGHVSLFPLLFTPAEFLVKVRERAWIE